MPISLQSNCNLYILGVMNNNISCHFIACSFLHHQVSWTHALRTIVQDCYKHHGRDDLLPEFNDSEPCQQGPGGPGGAFPHHTMVQTINNPDGTVSIIQIDTGETGVPQVVTLADGTQAHIVHTVSDSRNFA